MHDKPAKNELMARIKSKNSKAELLVYRYLRKNNIYFQKHYRNAPGVPDITLPRKKIAIFIDGDFWHGHDYRRRKPQLTEYWLKKIQGNMTRDKKQIKELEDSGWTVLRVWESDINRKRTQEEVLNKIKNFLIS